MANPGTIFIGIFLAALVAVLVHFGVVWILNRRRDLHRSTRLFGRPWIEFGYTVQVDAIDRLVLPPTCLQEVTEGFLKVNPRMHEKKANDKAFGLLETLLDRAQQDYEKLQKSTIEWSLSRQESGVTVTLYSPVSSDA